LGALVAGRGVQGGGVVHPEVGLLVARHRSLLRSPTETIAPAASRQSPARPLGSAIWKHYDKVSYARIRGLQKKREVWNIIGGSVGELCATYQTCAGRLSYALNRGGAPIRDAQPGWSLLNDPKVAFGGTKGDGLEYIVKAAYLRDYLTEKWGQPDATFGEGDAGNAQARTFARRLQGGEVAVFAGERHCGLMMPGYTDPYVFRYSWTMPAVAWKLRIR
jgi:Type VI secretion system (T6SS), amidase effector protein 4